MLYTVFGSIRALTDAGFAAGYAAMPPARQARCDAYRQPDDKKRCVLADVLVRRELAALMGQPPHAVKIRLSRTGKPFVDSPGICFSVSHAGDLVGAAFCDAEVGFDLEQIRPVPAAVLDRVCSHRDRAYILGNDASAQRLTDPAALRRFFEVWTFKEATVKRTGEGIAGQLQTVDFAPEKAFLAYPAGYVVCTVV